MFGSEISDVLTRDLKTKQVFRGVFASNALPTFLSQGQTHALVINFDTNDKPGSHWIGVFVRSSGSCVYFDPLGLPPMIPTIQRFIKRNSTSLTCNTMTIQNLL